jgi:hypothetical protein
LAGGTDTNLTLAVSPGSYLFWNYAMYPEVPVMIDSAKRMWGFSVSDPFLTWNNNGVITPVKYDVEVFHECTGYDSSGNRIDEIIYRVWCKGGFHAMPAGYLRDGVTQGYTGILHYTAV